MTEHDKSHIENHCSRRWMWLVGTGASVVPELTGKEEGRLSTLNGEVPKTESYEERYLSSKLVSQ